MDLHAIVVNTILSFKEPFTYQQLIKKIENDTGMDLSEKNTYSRVLSKIKELFEMSSIKVVPFSRPTKYFVEANI